MPHMVKIPAGASDSVLHDLIAEAGGFAPGAITEVRVLHDDSCPKLRGGSCQCEPELVVAITKGQAR